MTLPTPADRTETRAPEANPDGIRCPSCGSTATGVYDSRPSAGSIRRRRKCEACEHKFRTRECVDQKGRGDLTTRLGGLRHDMIKAAQTIADALVMMNGAEAE